MRPFRVVNLPTRVWGWLKTLSRDDKVALGICAVALGAALFGIIRDHLEAQRSQVHCEQLVSEDEAACVRVEHLLNTRVCMCWREPERMSKAYILP